MLESLQSKISNLVIINQKNSGLGAARNTALKQAKGECVWFIDGDDYIDENCIADFVQIIEQKNLDVLVLNYTPVDSDYKVLSKSVAPVYGGKDVISGSGFYSINYSLSYTPLFVFRRNLFVDHNVLFKERINMQDSEILPKLMVNTNRLSFFGKNAYYYVQQENSFTNSVNGLKRYKYFESIIEVQNSLNNFRNEILTKDVILAEAIQLKMDSLHTVVFNHLVYFRYQGKWLAEIIQLLRTNDFYPLKHTAIGKMKYVKKCLNSNPFLTKKVIDYLRK